MIKFLNRFTFVSISCHSEVVENGVSRAESKVYALYHQSKSVVASRRFRTTFGRETPKKMFIYTCCQFLNVAGCICKVKIPGKQPVP
jgi:hypothetical protein